LSCNFKILRNPSRKSLAPAPTNLHPVSRMNAKTLSLIVLSLSSIMASAHPGHDAGVLHLHLGTPAASNALDLRLTFAALILGLSYQALRSFKRR